MNFSPQRIANALARMAAVAALPALLLCARAIPAAADPVPAGVIHVRGDNAVIMFDDYELYAIQINMFCPFKIYPGQIITTDSLGAWKSRWVREISDDNHLNSCNVTKSNYAGKVDAGAFSGPENVSDVCREQLLIYKESDNSYMKLDDGTEWGILFSDQFNAAGFPLNGVIVVCGNTLIYESAPIQAQPPLFKRQPPPGPDRGAPAPAPAPGQTTPGQGGAAPRARTWPIMPRDLSTDMITQQEYKRLDQILPAYNAAITAYRPQFANTNITNAAGTILIISTMLEIEPRLIVALIDVESGFNSKTALKTGARVGLAGVDPKQCRRKWDLDASDDVGNITCGIFQIRMYAEKFKDSKDWVQRMLAAYRYGNAVTGKSRLTRQMDAYADHVINEFARILNGPLKGQSMDGS